MNKFLFSSILCLSMLGGCTQYEWGGYDKKLLNHYKKPDAEVLRDSLLSIARKGEPSHRVPPGLYGEIGYLFYETGQPDRAIQYFELEKALWPESAMIMDKMIRNAKKENTGKGTL